MAVDSYGRQLGHITDALAILIKEQSDWTRQPAFQQLITMRAKIEQIKAWAAARRLDRIAADILELRNKDDKSEYRRLVEKLRKGFGRRGSIAGVTDAAGPAYIVFGCHLFCIQLHRARLLQAWQFFLRQEPRSTMVA